MNTNKIIIGVCLILLIGFASSCELFTGSDLTDLGTLTIKLDDQINARSTLVPELSMDPSDYIITGVGPEGRSFGPVSISGGIFSITDLQKGAWVITVTAVNSDEFEIGIGTKTIEIEPNKTKTVQVTVVPFYGMGTLTLSGSWVAGDIADPHILAELVKDDGETQVLGFIIDDNFAVFSSDTIQAGFYTLRIGLYDGSVEDINNKLMGTVVAVRIVAGHETEGILKLTTEDLNVAGHVSVSIINAIKNPKVVTLNRSASSVLEGSTVTISASVAPKGDYSYEWYLNGDLIAVETGDSITLGEDLRLGKHFLDVIVSGNGVKSSASTSFTIVEQLGGYVSLTLTPNNDSDVSEYYLTAGLECDIDFSEDGTSFLSFGGIPVVLASVLDEEILGLLLISSDKPIPEDSMGGEYVHDEDLVRFYFENWTEDSVSQCYGSVMAQNDSDMISIAGEISIVINDYGIEGSYISGAFSGSGLSAKEIYFDEDLEEYDYREIEGLEYSLEGEFNVFRFLDIHLYHVTYDDNGAGRGDVPENRMFLEGGKAWVEANYYGLEKDGYVFLGWNTKADGTGTTYQPDDTFIMGTEHVTLYAIWEEAVLSTGSLEITINTNARLSKSILLPDISLEIDSYTIIGTGPNGGAYFLEEGNTDTTYVVDGLAIGTWQVTINGLNNEGITIGTALVSATIVPNQLTTVTANLVPVEGRNMDP